MVDPVRNIINNRRNKGTRTTKGISNGVERPLCQIRGNLGRLKNAIVKFFWIVECLLIQHYNIGLMRYEFPRKRGQNLLTEEQKEVK